MRFQQSLAGACVALLLVGGLVAMPTSCDCGAGIAHGHSLFVLGGHYHGADGAVFGAGADEMDDHHHHHQESPSAEPQFAGPVSYAADRLAADLPSYLTDSTNWERISYPDDNRHLSGGRIVVPEGPPPQVG